jgi:hypothetical protein
MLRRALIAGIFSLVLAGSAAAQPRIAQRQLLMPGVVYEQQVEFTNHGPVVIHVLTAPRPGGLYELKPVLSNGSILGTETVTSMQRTASVTATVGGVNGDLFTFASGRPTGGLIRDGVLDHAPWSGRSTVGIDTQGLLHVGRIQLLTTWQGLGPRRAGVGLNAPPGANGISLFTPAWGPATPPSPGDYEVVLQPFPPTTANAEVSGPVVATAQNGNVAIPPDGAVLAARGSAAARLAAEAPVGQAVIVRLLLRPEWPGIVQALGGGPLLVREGKPVFRAFEHFKTDQLLPRNPRTAVGQRADGKIVLLAVDGRQPGYSVGMTNFELAQALVRLGVVTGSALDAGGSTTMAFDGRLLSKPSDPAGERPVAESLLVLYRGVYAPPPTASVLSPNGDGIDEQQSLAYKVVRPSTVTATLVGPDKVARYSESGLREPGTYQIPWTGRSSAGAPEPQGRWQWTVQAVDDLGNRSSINRGFVLNNTLGFLKPDPQVLAVPRLKPRMIASTVLAQAASVLAWVETESGAPVVNVATGRVAAGRLILRWDGRNRAGRPVYPGRYVLRVRTTNAYGRAELVTKFRVVKAKFKVIRTPKRS